MIGYAAVVDVFDEGDKNKGLEGITSYPPTDRFFVLKEGEPGMLLELSGDLSTIINYKTLIQGNGFQDEGLPEKELDFSGLCYDKERDLFWIVSDKGQRVFSMIGKPIRWSKVWPLAIQKTEFTKKLKKLRALRWMEQVIDFT